jgi:hypothetical protein
MRYVVDPQQGRLFDPFQQIIPPLGLKYIASGWQSLFRAVLLPLMPVGKLGDQLHPILGRRSKELYSVAGLLFLQEAKGWTNDEAVHAYLFHTDVQFALNLEPGIDEMSLATFERYRAHFLDSDLGTQVMDDITMKLVDELDLHIDRQRLDSTHVFSDMASFGRTRMMAVCNKRFLTQVQRHHAADFAALPEELRKRYAPTQAKLFAAKGLSAEQRTKSRQQVAEDMRDLINRFADHAGLNQRPSYQALVTVFDQQCEIVAAKIIVKAKTGGRCVQNPSDLDATYDGHKGQGHKVQLVETCSAENDVQLILTVLPQTAVDNDANALIPVLADLEKKGLLPEAMLADTVYGSDENVQAAADLGVELVTPTPGNGSTATAMPTSDAKAPTPECATPPAPSMAKLTIEDFAVDERTGQVEACPSGRVPLTVLYDQGTHQDKIVIEMKPEDCVSCPFREACPVEKTKKGEYKVAYTPKQRRQEERRREEDTAAFRERYAKRSGLESTNGGLKRKHGLGELRVRGRPAVRHALFLKVAGWNLNRATASGKLTSKVAEILRRLGFGGWWEACFSLFCALLSVCRIWRLAMPLRAN